MGVYFGGSSVCFIRKFTAFSLVLVLQGQAVLSEPRTVLVELFTSQGCSSCPPADAILEKLSNRNDVVALAFHVDYWDYIGWKDSFADPIFSKRQKTYARLASRKGVYTPQFMVHGHTAVAGSNSKTLTDEILKAAKQKSKFKVLFEELDNEVRVNLIKVRPSSRIAADILAIYFTPKKTVKIQSGENSGRVMTYSNVVRNIVKLGEWDGLNRWSKLMPQVANQGLAVVIQSKGQGKVIAVAKLK